MTINWPWSGENNRIPDDPRMLQLAHDMAALSKALAVAVRRIEALEQQVASIGQTQSDIRATLTEVATVLRRWDGE